LEVKQLGQASELGEDLVVALVAELDSDSAQVEAEEVVVLPFLAT